MASRDGMQVIFSWSQAFLMMVSVQRGCGGGRNTPSGELGTFSFDPNTPMYDFDLVVVRGKFFVSDWPIVSHAVGRVRPEIRRPKAQRNAPPMVRPSALNPGPKPAER